MAEYPKHKTPEGSSKKVLVELSGKHTVDGRTQEFTVGSRAAEAGGIAAKGSQLEASALNMKPRKKSGRK